MLLNSAMMLRTSEREDWKASRTANMVELPSVTYQAGNTSHIIW